VRFDGSLSRRAFGLTEIAVQPQQSTWVRLDRDAPIDAHENAPDGPLNDFPNLPAHAAPQFLRQPLEVLLKGRRGELDDRLLGVPIQASQLGLQRRLALLRRSQGRLQRSEVPPRHGSAVIGDLAFHLR
jgi:hypothetical protein